MRRVIRFRADNQTLNFGKTLDAKTTYSSWTAGGTLVPTTATRPLFSFQPKSNFRVHNSLHHQQGFHSVVPPRSKDRDMARMLDTSFPKDIPRPQDDGAYNHLNDFSIPRNLALPIARDPTQSIDLSQQDGLTVVFCYPRTARPDETVPDEWNAIPGARGCTPQACSFRDNFSQLKQLGVSQVYGISTQSPSYQAEVHERLHLPYDLLSDEHLVFQKALKLPTFEWEGGKVLRRSSIIVKGGKVIKWFYPVFPPDKGVDDVITWLKNSE